MPNLSIKDVPESMADQLRDRAARHHRSLQGELMAIVEAALRHDDESAVAPRLRDAGSNRLPRLPVKSVEQIAAELRALFPQPVDDGPRAVDIVRAMRDER